MSNFIKSITELVSSKIGVYKAFINVFELETKLAAMGVFPLIVHICMTLVLLMTTWLSFMWLIAFFVIHYSQNVLFAILTVFLLNLGAFAILYRIAAANLRKMSFEKTREYFSNKREEDYHDVETKDLCPVTRRGSAIKNTTD